MNKVIALLFILSLVCAQLQWIANRVYETFEQANSFIDKLGHAPKRQIKHRPVVSAKEKEARRQKNK